MNDAPDPTAFQLLIDDIAELQATRYSRARQRDTVSRAARRIRPVCATAARPLRKSEPLPEYTPDWEGLAARQEQIAADLERSRVQQQKNAIRTHLATLRQAAKAGRLTAHDAALYDVYRGQAAALGLQP